MNMTWTDFKTTVDDKVLSMQYIISNGYYHLWVGENGTMYECDIEIVEPTPVDSDQQDFEDNYKDNCNAPIQPKTDDGKYFVRAESRPLDMTTCFTCKGDSATVVGGGTSLIWNVATDGDDFVAINSNFKRKVIDFGFRDEICIKEGTLYFFETSWYGELQLWSYLPAAYSPTGYDLFMDNFVVSLLFHSDCPMGDELNTECASDRIPSYIRHQIYITVPISDTKSRGYVNLEVYRSYTI